MAHVESYKLSGAVGMLRHDERKADSNVQSRKNECIDSSRTELNYNLAPKRYGKNLREHIEKVCNDNEVRLSNRKDLNVMSSWVITAPKILLEQYPDKQKEFFERCYEFLSERYGEKFVLSSTVHLDETTPHMHFTFIPVGYDKKNDRLTVSSKLTITRADLKTFHRDLEKYIKSSMKLDLPILNEATSSGNMSIEELKRQSAKERLQEATERASKIVSKARNEAQRIESGVDDLNSVYEAQKAFVTKINEANYTQYPYWAVVTSKGLLNKKKYVTIPQEEWEKIWKQLSAYRQVEEFVKNIDNFISTKKVKEQNKKIEHLSQALYTLTYEKNYLKQANSEKSEIIQELRAAIIKMPKEERDTVVSIFRKYKVRLFEKPPQVVKKNNFHKQ